MKLPQKRLGQWAKELISQCLCSVPQRVSQYGAWQTYYFNGQNDPNPAKYNRIYGHIDRLSSFLFSSDDISFGITFDRDVDHELTLRAEVASKVINRHFHRRGVDLEFSAGVDTALIKGKSLLKLGWGHDGIEPWLIQPEYFGVLREDIDGLDRQEAFVHTTYITKNEFDRQLTDHPDEAEIRRQVEKSFSHENQEEKSSYLHQVIIGGINPVQPNAPSSKNNVTIAGAGVPTPVMDPKVVQDLVCVHELWVVDSERDDWTTIRVVDDVVLEGKLRHRNLTGVKNEQPFIEICPNRVDGYFWGHSEVCAVAPLQEMLNDSLAQIDRLTRLKAQPPSAFIGFSGMTEGKYRALMAPGGYISEDTPTAKIERLAPEIPPELFQKIEKVIAWMDEVGGFTPIIMGQGEPGVRAGTHAQTLLRTGSPRLRDRALLVERQATFAGDLCFKFMQSKDAKVYNFEGGAFVLRQLPDDYRVAVDSHSGSPVFHEDSERLAFLLQRAGALDAADLIMLTRPPHRDTLLEHAKARAKAEAQMIAQHPELLLKGKKPAGKR